MPLNKTELEVLRKQYPENQYTIKEKESGLQIVPKTAVIRIFSKQLKHFREKIVMQETGNIDVELLKAIDKAGLKKEDFEQQQITVEKKVSDRITEEAKKCRTRKIIYLQRLLNGVKK